MAGASLITCTLVAFFYFWGSITMQQYKTILFVGIHLLFRFCDAVGDPSKQSGVVALFSRIHG